MRILNNTIKKYRAYCLTAILTTVSLIVLLYVLKIYPFGDKTFLWADADQYFAIEHYFGSITGKNDIFYSWNNVLGGNVLSELAYYSFSPFNVIYMVFINHMIFAAHFIVYLKILLASLTFCYCLEYNYKDDAYKIKAVLSVSYAFMGYMIFFGWNTSWMDGIIILPVMYVGIIKLINKENALQYIISLAIAIISNFYIGFMICLCSFILYVMIISMHKNGLWIGIKKTFFPYLFCSLVSVGLTAFILLPTYLALPDVRKLTLVEMFREMYAEVKPIIIVSGLFTGQVNTIDANAPLIYIGIFPLFLIAVFFVSEKALVKKKMVYALVTVIMMLSFINSFINKIWHGMSNNTWFNFRYSFFVSFVLLLISYDAFLLIRDDRISEKEFIKAGIILIILALFVLNSAEEKTNITAISMDIVFISFFVLMFVGKCQNRKIFFGLLVMQLVCCSVVNGYFYLRDYSMQSTRTYCENKKMMNDAMKLINDDSFYRMDKNFQFGRCDAKLFDYKGVTNYASTENIDNLVYLRKLGVSHTWMWGKYTSNMPESSEALLGIKYVLTDTSNSKNYELLGIHDNIQICKNLNALPILFPTECINDFDIESLNDFELQNEIWKSINGLDKNVFVQNDVYNKSSDGNNLLDVKVNRSGTVYLSVPYGSYNSIFVEGSNNDMEIVYDDSCELYYLGEFSEGSSFYLRVITSDENYSLDNIVCYTEDKSVLDENSRIMDSFKIDISEISSSYIEMSFVGRRKNISTSIPYDEGWTIYDNDVKIDKQKNWGNFLSFSLEKTGAHKIKLIYRPIGFTKGLIISIISLAVIVMYEAYYHITKRKIMCDR